MSMPSCNNLIAPTSMITTKIDSPADIALKAQFDYLKNNRVIKSEDMTTPSAYVEPDMPLMKNELFDEDNMKALLRDPNFNKGDISKLSIYNKHRKSGSKVSVSYKYGMGCEEHKLGRVFPDDEIGLQSFRFDMRNPLTAKHYWDIDVENCHYVIAIKFCEDYGIKCDAIKYYVQNRNSCLAMVSPNRKYAKTQFLKVLYGGNIKLYSEQFNDEDGEQTQDGHEFLLKIKKEVDTLGQMIWMKYPQYHKLKTGKEKKSMDKKQNPIASLMSLIFQTEERKMLFTLDRYLTANNRYMGVYIHDGGLVEKLEKETEFPSNLLKGGAEYITATLEYKHIVLTQKLITFEWTPYKPQETQYEVKKREFEIKNFLVGAMLCCIHSDGEKEFMKMSEAKVKFGNLIIDDFDNTTQKVKRRKFIDMWLEDEKRLQYERMDFFPNREACPPSIYNLFKGFNAEKYRPDEAMTKETINELIKPVLDHIEYITGGYGDYLLKWLANIIQTPHLKSEVAPLIRDMGGLLIEGGGTGKNTLFDWFGQHIIGEDYYVVIGDNKELYSNFNSLFEGKLLVFVEEASGRDNHNNTDLLKSKITGKKSNINKKNVAQYRVNDFARYVFTSNNRNPLPIRQGDRRFAVFDTNTCKRGDEKYFIDLYSELDRNEVKWAFFKYLSELNTYDSPIKFMKEVPKNDAYRDIRLLNAPLYLKWLIYNTKRGLIQDKSTSDLYKEYCLWISTNREGSTEGITQTAFSLLLTNATEIQIDGESANINGGDRLRNRSGMIFKWNIEGLIEGLKKLLLLNNDFIYKTHEQLEDEQFAFITA
jgi:hypothetical protein